MLPNSFYLAFGNLLYAIAMSDEEIQAEEVEEFHKITRSELKNLSENPESEVNHFNTLLADSGFLNSYHAKLPADEALEKFIQYYRDHKDLFNEWVKAFCLNSVVKVAEAFDGIVTEEKQIILKLINEFDH